MIFDDMLEQIDSLILRQPESIKESIFSLEKTLSSGLYQVDSSTELELLKIQKQHKIFKVDYGNLVFKNDNIDIQYSFEDYPLSFERALFFKKSYRQNVRVFSTYDLERKEYHIACIDIVHRDELNNIDIFRYDHVRKKLKNNDKEKFINHYNLLIENESKPDIKDFLLLTHDIDIEKESLYVDFLETLHHFRKCINKSKDNIKLKI